MNAWDTDPQYLSAPWRGLFRFFRRRREPLPVGRWPALG